MVEEPHRPNCHNTTAPFICVERLVELMRSSKVTLLDARPPPTTSTRQPGLGKTIPGAVRTEWQEFMQATASGEELRSPEDIAAVFRSKGVSNEQPVVIFGSWSAEGAWGEEGRIWWQLWWLNHKRTYILFGGIWAWDPAVHKERQLHAAFSHQSITTNLRHVPILVASVSMGLYPSLALP
jgi:3-mercaptopyruvate sulfurtransferase SseA